MQKLATLVLLCCVCLMAVGCDTPKGNEAKDAMKKAGEKVKEAAEKTGEAVKEGVEAVGKGAESVVEKATGEEKK